MLERAQPTKLLRGIQVSRKTHGSPVKTYGAVALFLAVIATVTLVRTIDFFGISSAWLASVNLITLIFLIYDKNIAHTTATRIPERVLIGLVFVGGSPMALVAMRLLRHKTSKASFQWKFWSAVAAQLVLIALWYLWFRPRF